MFFTAKWLGEKRRKGRRTTPPPNPLGPELLLRPVTRRLGAAASRPATAAPREVGTAVSSAPGMVAQLSLNCSSLAGIPVFNKQGRPVLPWRARADPLLTPPFSRWVLDQTKASLYRAAWGHTGGRTPSPAFACVRGWQVDRAKPQRTEPGPRRRAARALPVRAHCSSALRLTPPHFGSVLPEGKALERHCSTGLPGVKSEGKMGRKCLAPYLLGSRPPSIF